MSLYEDINRGAARNTITDRAITNDDLWSAVRGLGMARMSYDELTALVDKHRENPLFASRVITEAATQYAAIRRARDAADAKAEKAAKRRRRR